MVCDLLVEVIGCAHDGVVKYVYFVILGIAAFSLCLGSVELALACRLYKQADKKKAKIYVQAVVAALLVIAMDVMRIAHAALVMSPHIPRGAVSVLFSGSFLPIYIFVKQESVQIVEVLKKPIVGSGAVKLRANWYYVSGACFLVSWVTMSLAGFSTSFELRRVWLALTSCFASASLILLNAPCFEVMVRLMACLQNNVRAQQASGHDTSELVNYLAVLKKKKNDLGPSDCEFANLQLAVWCALASNQRIFRLGGLLSCQPGHGVRFLQDIAPYHSDKEAAPSCQNPALCSPSHPDSSPCTNSADQ